MLTAVNVELDGKTMTLAATDRYRLAVRELDWNPAPGTAEQGRIALLVPARTLSDAARMMSHDAVVRIAASHGGDGPAAAPPGRGASGAAEAMIGFETGERRLTARLLAGEFIRYRSRFPEEFGCTADLPARRVRGGGAPGRAGRGAGHPGAAHVPARPGHDRRGDAGPGQRRRRRSRPISPVTSRRSRSARITCSTG